jgi:hypothetical protein
LLTEAPGNDSNNSVNQLFRDKQTGLSVYLLKADKCYAKVPFIGRKRGVAG